MTTKNNVPKISVIMPVHNAERFLREAIDSILRQTFENFELIIIDDGSTDRSPKIINEYAKKDSRIITLRQKNSGVVATANKAVVLARGKYIARMDADDVSLPDRLMQESKILDNNPSTVLVCGSFEVFDEQGEFRFKDVVPPDGAHLKRSLFLRNPIANGSTLIRKTALESAGLFDDVFAEDLHMWTKLVKLGDFASTGTVIYRWRMNPEGLTLTNHALSMSKGKEYINSLWSEKKPEHVTRRHILRTLKSYDKFDDRSAKSYRDVFLADISQLSSKLFLYGYYWSGLRQLFVLASTGRKGAGAAMKRVYYVVVGRYSKLRRASTAQNPYGER